MPRDLWITKRKAYMRAEKAGARNNAKRRIAWYADCTDMEITLSVVRYMYKIPPAEMGLQQSSARNSQFHRQRRLLLFPNLKRILGVFG